MFALLCFLSFFVSSTFGQVSVAIDIYYSGSDGCEGSSLTQYFDLDSSCNSLILGTGSLISGTFECNNGDVILTGYAGVSCTGDVVADGVDISSSCYSDTDVLGVVSISGSCSDSPAPANGGDCVSSTLSCTTPFDTCITNSGDDVDAVCSCYNTFISCIPADCTDGVNLTQYDGCSNGCFQADYVCLENYGSCEGSDTTDVSCDCLSDLVNCYSGCFSTVDNLAESLIDYGRDGKCYLPIPGWNAYVSIQTWTVDIECSDSATLDLFVIAVEANFTAHLPGSWSGYITTTISDCVDNTNNKRAVGATVSTSTNFYGPSSGTQAAATSTTSDVNSVQSADFSGTVTHSNVEQYNSANVMSGAVAAILFSLLSFFIYA